MPSLPFTTVDVFTTTRYDGNPLAIVHLPADHAVSTEQMQTIAREFNLSETVIIHETSPGSASPEGDGIPEWRLRIFMTQAELPFAGHPTIGSACYALGTLAKGAKQGRLVCNAGPIEVEFGDGVARASIPHTFHRHVENEMRIEEAVALQPALKDAGPGVVKGVDVVSPVKGMNFIAIELDSVENLAKVQVTGVRPTASLDREWDVGFCGSYFYTILSSEGDMVKVRTRMIEGTMEDPATGSAACGLSSFLAMKLGREGRRTRFEIVQGVEMGRRSEIGVEVTLREGGEQVESVVLSGSAVGVMEGKVEVCSSDGGSTAYCPAV